MRNAKAYQTKTRKFTGTSYIEIYKKAVDVYAAIRRRSKRRVHIRSAYFNKDKVFLSLFWQHLGDKHYRDRIRRLRYFPCALDLIRNSRIDPTSIQNTDRKSEILHRFTGITTGRELFFVQIKENKRTGQKYLISVFPKEKNLPPDGGL